MIYNLLIATILIVAFFMCVKAYCLGLKHGKQLIKLEVPTLDIPKIDIKPLTEHFKDKKQESSFIDGYWK